MQRPQRPSLILALSVGCLAGCVPPYALPPPTMSIADAHRVPSGAIEPFVSVPTYFGASGIGSDSFSGPLQLGVHAGLVAGMDLSLRFGGGLSSQEMGLQLAGPISQAHSPATTASLDWMAGLGVASENGTTGTCDGKPVAITQNCPQSGGSEQFWFLSFAPYTGLRGNVDLNRFVSLTLMARVSYARTLNLQGLNGVAPDWNVYVEAMGGVTARPIPALRLGLGLGMVGSLRNPGPSDVPVGELSGSVSWQF